MPILTDNDVRRAPAVLIVDAARRALLQAGRGGLMAPRRARNDLGNIDYVYTADALADGTGEFRVDRAGCPGTTHLSHFFGTRPTLWAKLLRARRCLLSEESEPLDASRAPRS